MWTLIAALSCLLALTHGLYPLLPEMTPARWFYVLRGLEGAALWLVPLFMIRRTPTRSQSICFALLAVIGGTLEMLTSICGLAFYWGKGPLPAPSGGLMCDAAHPQGMAWLSIAICVAILAIGMVRRNDGNTS